MISYDETYGNKKTESTSSFGFLPDYPVCKILKQMPELPLGSFDPGQTDKNRRTLQENNMIPNTISEISEVQTQGWIQPRFLKAPHICRQLERDDQSVQKAVVPG
jgi:hypothetical protein